MTLPDLSVGRVKPEEEDRAGDSDDRENAHKYEQSQRDGHQLVHAPDAVSGRSSACVT